MRKMGVIVLEDIPKEWVATHKALKPVQRFIRQTKNGDGDKTMVRQTRSQW